MQQNSEIELSEPQHPWNSGDVQPFTGCVSGLLFFHLLDLTVLNFLYYSVVTKHTAYCQIYFH
jgi:hypothetical protein